MTAPYKLNDKEWNESWEFIDNIDIMKHIRRYSTTDGKIKELHSFMEYLELVYDGEYEHSPYLFNCISTEDFKMYLRIRYKKELIFRDISYTTIELKLYNRKE